MRFDSITFNKAAKDLGLDRGLLLILRKKAHRLYQDKLEAKKSSGYRTISAPTKELKEVQRKILEVYFANISWPDHIHGGRSGRSIQTNASIHLKQKTILTIDIKDFFPSIRIEHIRIGLLRIGFNFELIEVLLPLITHNYCLPQGAPTSSAIANAVLLGCDENILNLCKNANLKYTRFIDDLNISGRCPEKFQEAISRIIRQAGFSINENKILIQRSNKPQFVTGLQVNDKLKIPPIRFKSILDRLSEIERAGNRAVSSMKELAVLSGQIAFLKTTNPVLGKRLQSQLRFLRKNLNAIGIDYFVS